MRRSARTTHTPAVNRGDRWFPFLHLAAEVPLDISARIHDGHRGSVPIRQSLDAYNEIARATGAPVVSDAEISQLSAENGRLASPHERDLVDDEILGRAVYFRRRADLSRVTIFEGGHEGISASAFDWLARHSKPTSVS